MTTFDARENAFEAEFVHQQDVKFRVREQAVKLLALWAAGLLDKGAQASEAYAQDLVAADVVDPQSGAALARVMTDLRAKGISEQQVRQASDRFFAEADNTIRGVKS